MVRCFFNNFLYFAHMSFFDEKPRNDLFLVVLSLFHFIYNKGVFESFFYESVTYVWNNFGRNSAFGLRPVAVVFQT